ncbi:MAG: hypothetical protein QUS35_04600 [bacterium]|nr:hypothetical protein [bacterium]
MDCASCGRDIRQAEKQYETGGRMLCETCYIYHVRDRILSSPEKEESAFTEVRCPKCGTLVQEASWRCRECYFEFENYDFTSHRFIGKPRVRRKKGRPDAAL